MKKAQDLILRPFHHILYTKVQSLIKAFKQFSSTRKMSPAGLLREG